MTYDITMKKFQRAKGAVNKNGLGRVKRTSSISLTLKKRMQTLI